VCEDIVDPFVQEIYTATGYDDIYLVEDNTPCHQIVQRVDSDGRTELSQSTLNCPSNSPDLRKIEQCWDPMKDDISIYRIVGASLKTVMQAKVISSRLQLHSSHTLVLTGNRLHSGIPGNSSRKT